LTEWGHEEAPNYFPEVIERAVRMVNEAASEYSSQWAAIESIAAAPSPRQQTPNTQERRSPNCSQPSCNVHRPPDLIGQLTSKLLHRSSYVLLFPRARGRVAVRRCQLAAVNCHEPAHMLPSRTTFVAA
jgi:hypothetical protein